MAHANLHMAAGMAVATSVTLWPVLRAWSARAAMAPAVARMLLASYALGAWALVPNLATRLGVDPGIHHARWTNVFLGHAWIDGRTEGGLLIGELVIVAILGFHYAVLVAAIARVGRPSPR